MGASQSTIYPDDVTLVRARREQPVRISVGNDTLSYGSTTSLGSTLTAGQTMVITADTYIQTAANGAVVLQTFEPWDPEIEGDEESSGEDIRVAREAPLNVEYREFARLVTGDDWTDAFQAAIDEADPTNSGEGGDVIFSGNKQFSDRITVPQYVNLRGLGTGSRNTAQHGAVLKATHANAQLMFESRGGLSGGFTLDGNDVADRAKGILYSNLTVHRTFQDINVTGTAGDGVVIEQSQNNVFESMFVEYTGGNAWTLDLGAGGNLFLRANAADADGYGLKVTESAGTGPYAEPTHNQFIQCVWERYNAGTIGGAVLIEEGTSTRFTHCVAAVDSDVTITDTDAVVQVDAGELIFDNLRIYGAATHNGIRTETGTGIYSLGLLSFISTPDAWVYNGGSGSAAHIVYNSVTNRWTGTGTASTGLSFSVQRSLWVTADTNEDAVIARFARSGETQPRVTISNSGQIQISDGTNAADSALIRSAANKLGTAAGDSFLVADELEVDGALNHDGTTVGFYGKAPVTQAAKINDPSGGGTQDAEARTAINAIIDALEGVGISASA